MDCPFCGNAADANAGTCGNCGADLRGSKSANPFHEDAYVSPLAEPMPRKNGANDLALKMIVPIGRSGYAIAAGYAGLISLGCCPLGPVAVLLGILAFRDIKRNPHLGGKGRVIFGIVTGIVGAVGLILMVISMAVA